MVQIGWAPWYSFHMPRPCTVNKKILYPAHHYHHRAAMTTSMFQEAHCHPKQVVPTLGISGRSENVSSDWAKIYLPWSIYTTQDMEMPATRTVINKNVWYWNNHRSFLPGSSTSRKTCQRGKPGKVFFVCVCVFLVLSFFSFLYNSHLNYLLGEEYKWASVGPHESCFSGKQSSFASKSNLINFVMCCGNKLLEMIQNTYVKLSKNKWTTQLLSAFLCRSIKIIRGDFKM